MKNQSRLHNLFLHKKPAEMLIKIKEGNGKTYASILAKEVDCTYSHTVKLLDDFKKLGLVRFRKQGRIKIIELTEDGEDLAHSIEGVLIKLSRIKEKEEKQ